MNVISIKDKVVPRQAMISVIVPVYNVDKFISRCIESILNQNFTNIELILIDDGSTDNSVNICSRYVEVDSRVKLFQQSNQGSSVARNTGLSHAKGEYISFVDSDDWIMPEMLEIMFDFLTNNSLEVVECESIRSTDLHTEQFKSKKNTTIKIETSEEALDRVIENQNFAVWRRLYHKSVIGNLRFIPYKIHQDVFFTIDILKKINHQGYITKALYIYNVENISVIRSPYSQKKLDAIDAVFYVLNETKNFNTKVRITAKKHVIKVLRYHYHELYSHPYLDQDYKMRRLIRTEIVRELTYKSWSAYGIIIKYLPLKVYPIFLWLNNRRISAQIYLLKSLR